MLTYKSMYSFEERKNEATKILNKSYPKKVPVIIEVSKKSIKLLLDKKKYLVPSEITVGQFMYIIRKRIKLNSETALFFFVNNTIPMTSMLMSELYDRYKDDDLFLTITISSESTFGF